MAKKVRDESSGAAAEMARRRWKATTKEERRDHGRMMANTRWRRVKAEPKKAS